MKWISHICCLLFHWCRLNFLQGLFKDCLTSRVQCGKLTPDLLELETSFNLNCLLTVSTGVRSPGENTSCPGWAFQSSYILKFAQLPIYTYRYIPIYIYSPCWQSLPSGGLVAKGRINRQRLRTWQRSAPAGLIRLNCITVRLNKILQVHPTAELLAYARVRARTLRL